MPLLCTWCSQTPKSMPPLCTGDKHIFVFCGDKHNFVKTKFCRDKTKRKEKIEKNCDNSFVAASILLLRQTRICRDKTRLLSRRKYFATTKKEVYLPRQNYVFRDKISLLHFLSRQIFVVFVATSILLSRQKTSFVATKLLPRQKWYL